MNFAWGYSKFFAIPFTEFVNPDWFIKEQDISVLKKFKFARKTSPIFSEINITVNGHTPEFSFRLSADANKNCGVINPTVVYPIDNYVLEMRMIDNLPPKATINLFKQLIEDIKKMKVVGSPVYKHISDMGISENEIDKHVLKLLTARFLYHCSWACAAG